MSQENLISPTTLKVLDELCELRDRLSESETLRSLTEQTNRKLTQKVEWLQTHNIQLQEELFSLKAELTFRECDGDVYDTNRAEGVKHVDQRNVSTSTSFGAKDVLEMQQDELIIEFKDSVAQRQSLEAHIARLCRRAEELKVLYGHDRNCLADISHGEDSIEERGRPQSLDSGTDWLQLVHWMRQKFGTGVVPSEVKRHLERFTPTRHTPRQKQRSHGESTDSGVALSVNQGPRGDDGTTSRTPSEVFFDSESMSGRSVPIFVTSLAPTPTVATLPTPSPRRVPPPPPRRDSEEVSYHNPPVPIQFHHAKSNTEPVSVRWPLTPPVTPPRTMMSPLDMGTMTPPTAWRGLPVPLGGGMTAPSLGTDRSMASAFGPNVYGIAPGTAPIRTPPSAPLSVSVLDSPNGAPRISIHIPANLRDSVSSNPPHIVTSTPVTQGPLYPSMESNVRGPANLEPYPIRSPMTGVNVGSVFSAPLSSPRVHTEYSQTVPNIRFSTLFK